MRKDFLVAVFMTSLLLTGCERLERTSKTGAEPQAIAKSADIPTITLDLLSEDLVGRQSKLPAKWFSSVRRAAVGSSSKLESGRPLSI